MSPDISVILPVYNGENTILPAVNSIIEQSFTNFELIIIDDGSNDKTLEILSSIIDERILVVRNRHNYIESLNIGLQKAKSKYIARMDADDYMHPDRLRTQWTFMEEHPDVDICSTWMRTFGDAKNIIANGKGKINNVMMELLRGNFINHPTVMMRREKIELYNLSYEEYNFAEDYKLWFESAKHGLFFYVLPVILHYYRLSSSQQSQNRVKMSQVSTRIKEEILEYMISSQNDVCMNAFLNSAYMMYKRKIFSIEQTCNLFSLGIDHSSKRTFVSQDKSPMEMLG